MDTMISYQPLHAQLKELIITSIESGSYPAGTRLPSQRELCQQHRMSHMTVRRAINELVGEGYIVAIPGRGLFVKEKRVTYPLENFKGFNTLTREGGQFPSSQVLQARLMRASADLARDLLISEDSEVVYLHRLRFINDRPVMIQQSWLPHEICPGILANDFATASLFEVLANDYEIKVIEGQQTISARLATQEERHHLKLPASGVVLIVEALEFSHLHRPVEFSISIFNPQIHPLRQTNRAGSTGN
jgi:GntR family transcriptional regulator